MCTKTKTLQCDHQDDQHTKRQKEIHLRQIMSEECNILKPILSVPLVLPLTVGTLYFSKTFPAILWAKSTEYYIPAGFEYDSTNTFFDNSIWTYGTDYVIAIFMAYGTWRCISCEGGYLNENLRKIAAGLLACYTISVIFGGLAHEYYLTLESLNTISFRVMWTICVGTVALAGGFIGAVGTELGMKFESCNMQTHFKVPILPHYFWVCWSVVLTVICAKGGLSYKRPACDIFIAGTTQTTPTAYSILVVFSRYWANPRCNNSIRKEPSVKTFNNRVIDVNKKINRASIVSKGLSDRIHVMIRRQNHFMHEVTLSDRIIFYVSLLLNAPLLPVYPILLDYKLNLSTINTLLHSNLFVAWGLQFYSLWRFCVILSRMDENTPTFAKSQKRKSN